MTTAVHQKPDPAIKAPAPQPAKILFQGMIAIDKIDAFSNIRKTMNAEKLKQLTDSVRQRGVKQAVLLRPSSKPGHYFIVDGHRRLKAATAAGLKDVPAIVQDLTAEEAAIDQAVTYLQREDLSPIEEARGFLLLTQPGGTAQAKYTVEQLAKIVDKSVGYVYRAIRLVELPKKVVDLIEAGDWTPAHGHQLLRVAAVDREKFLEQFLSSWEYCNGGQTTARHLQHFIESHLGKDLNEALFSKTKPYAGENACAVCPFNSGNQGQLFEGAEKGTCSKPTCFDKKTDQHWEDFRGELIRRFPGASTVKIIPGHLSVGTEIYNLRMTETVKDKTKLRDGGSIYHSVPNKATFTAYPIPKKKATKSAPAAAQAKADPKDEFVREAVGVGLLKALAAKSTKLTKKHLVQVLEHLVDNHYTETDRIEKALGFGLEPGQLNETELAQAITLVMLDDHPNCMDKSAFKDLGVDVAAVTKKSEQEGSIAWAASWGRKHLSVANSGSKTACGLETLNYKTATEKGISVPMDKDVTCPDCKKSAYMKR